jgi:Cu2+-containing amine oxidase
MVLDREVEILSEEMLKVLDFAVPSVSTSPFSDGSSESQLAGAYNLNKQHGYLSEEEITHAVQITKLRHCGKELQFIEVNFKEPSKQSLIESYMKKSPLLRTVEVISMILDLNQTCIDTVVIDGNADTNKNTLIEVHLNNGTQIIKDVQTGLSPDEYAFVEKLCRSYQPLLDAITARGLDPAGLRADAW